MGTISAKLRERERPTLSLVMIVKNEAETLERCLTAAHPHVDEIVIVDTGSTDGTQAIARQYADVFDEIEWPDSFSAARNHSFDLATSDYIIYLDGDEYLPDVSHWQQIHRALRRSNVVALQILLCNLLSEGQILAADRGWQERVVLNKPSIRFIGRVHNQIVPSIKAYMQHAGAQVIRVPAEVIHTGYALEPTVKKAKYQARLHLLLAEYEQPRSEKYRSYYGYQLAVVYIILERYTDALEVIQALDYDVLTPDNAFYTHLLGTQAALHADDLSAALTHVDHMFALSQTEPVAYFLSGLSLLHARQFSDGLLMLMQAYEMTVVPEDDTPIRFVLDATCLLNTLQDACRQLHLTNYADEFARLSAPDVPDLSAALPLVRKLRFFLVQAERQLATLR